MKYFAQDEIQAIADALGDTSDGLTGSEIAHLLQSCGMKDIDASLTKRIRLYNALVNDQNKRHNRTGILEFIRRAMKPSRFLREPHRFEPMRKNLNTALSFSGLSVNNTGLIKSSTRAHTLDEAHQRANELRSDLSLRNVHPDVLAFCRAELLADNFLPTTISMPY